LRPVAEAQEVVTVVLPVLAHGEQLRLAAGAHVLEPLDEEGGVDVLHGVEAHAVYARGLHVPTAPAEQLLAHLVALDVDVAAEQVVVVAELGVDVLYEPLPLEEVDGLEVGVVVVAVDGVEVPPVPLEAGVLPAAAGEPEARPGADLPRLADGLRA